MTQIYNNGKSAPSDRATAGPFDVAERSESSGYLDFGAIRVPQLSGLTVKLEVEEATSRIIAITLEHDGSTVQLQAFSAPKSEGLWHEIRTQLLASIDQQGGLVREQSGALGPELLATLNVVDNDGKVIGTKQLRFAGIDGPRWFLRAVVSGAALTDARAQSDIDDLIRSIVVKRGDAPMPPRDLLDLTTPDGRLPNSRIQ
jgi:Protein of unknown function (DUF3710)